MGMPIGFCQTLKRDKTGAHTRRGKNVYEAGKGLVDHISTSFAAAAVPPASNTAGATKQPQKKEQPRSFP